MPARSPRRFAIAYGSMKVHIVTSIGLTLALAACAQDSQTLPFSPQSEESTVRTISATQAATVTSPAGATLRFPAGALHETTEVAITPLEAPTGAAASGAPISRGFRVDPEGLELGEPARVEMRIEPGADPSRVWLASLVVISPAGVQEVGATRLDLRARLAEASITRLGTLAMVIPEQEAVFETRSGGAQASLSASSSSLLPSGTDSIVAACGGRGARCTGLKLTASENLTEKISRAAAVYPQVFGKLRLDGVSASGEVELRSAVRLLLASGATAENIEVRGLLRPTEATVVSEDAASITLTNVLVRVGGSAGSEEDGYEEIRTVVVEKSGDRGFVTLSRTFRLDVGGGDVEEASVRITFPVRVHQ